MPPAGNRPRPGPAGARRRRRLCAQRRGELLVLVEDRRLELAQLDAGLEAELVAERPAQHAIHLERVGLPAHAIEGEHEQTMGPLAQRVRSDELLQRPDRLLRAPEREQRLEPLLVDEQALRLQALALQRCERLVEKVRKRRTAPERERLFGCDESHVRLGGAVYLLGEPLEAGDVQRLVGNVEAEAAAVRREHSLRSGAYEHLAQPRDVDVDRVCGGRGRAFAPQGVDQHGPRDRAVSVEQQEGQESGLLAAADHEAGAVSDPDGAQQPELQH